MTFTLMHSDFLFVHSGSELSKYKLIGESVTLSPWLYARPDIQAEQSPGLTVFPGVVFYYKCILNVRMEFPVPPGL